MKESRVGLTVIRSLIGRARQASDKQSSDLGSGYLDGNPAARTSTMSLAATWLVMSEES